MKHKTDKYAEFADHPRYGRRPNVTGLDPDPTHSDVQLHWNTTTHHEIVAQFEAVLGSEWPYGDFSAYSRGTRIPNTAIIADTTRQSRATVPVTHYFDLERKCCDCSRPFIFFAQEQKHWYEELGFGLESDCVRCAECRKTQQGIARRRELYETLFHVETRTEEQTLQMADACLSLIESDTFTARQTERVRMLLNSISDDSDIRKRPGFTDLVKRTLAAEQKGVKPNG
ncbi:MAG: zinc-ribbon domain-containing protein [Pirellulales bacterium]